MGPLKAARIIHILSDKANRDPRFIAYIVSKIKR